MHWARSWEGFDSSEASEPFVLPGKAFKETAKACQAGMSSARTAASFLRDLVNSQAGCGADRADGGEVFVLLDSAP